MTGFHYSLNSSTIKTTPILQKIQVAAEAGYEGIELWHDDIDKFLGEGGTLQQIRSELDAAGLQVPTTIHLKQWFQSNDDEYVLAIQDARRKFEQAAAVGAKYTVAGPPHGTANRTLGAARYRELIAIGREFGVCPAFEYLGFVQDMKTIDDAIEIIQAALDPDACVVLDPFHCYVGGGPMDSIGKLQAHQIAVSHFNDAPSTPNPAIQRDPDRVMPGDGSVYLKLYCDLLRSIGYKGFLSLELFRPDLWEKNPLDVAREGLQKMKAAAEA